MGTSLRSLQAVRNSRSLEIDDYQPADSQINNHESGVKYTQENGGGKKDKITSKADVILTLQVLS